MKYLLTKCFGIQDEPSSQQVSAILSVNTVAMLSRWPTITVSHDQCAIRASYNVNSVSM